MLEIINEKFICLFIGYNRMYVNECIIFQLNARRNIGFSNVNEYDFTTITATSRHIYSMHLH